MDFPPHSTTSLSIVERTGALLEDALLDMEWLHINNTAVNNNRLNVACFYRCYDRIDDDDDNLHYDQWVRFNLSPENTGITKITPSFNSSNMCAKLYSTLQLKIRPEIRQRHELIIMFQDTVRPGCEFVETSCERTNFPRITIYRNNHNQILKHETTSSRARPNVKSVILIVLDSVSHASFVLKILYKSYIFDGMNKIGDQSFPNAVAFLAGRDYQTEFGDVKGFFDEHPLIWKDFQNKSYTTYYAEDYPNFNLFNYLAKGFRKKPVHHYFRPFWLNVYGSYLHRRSKFLCYGNQAMHNIELNYLSQFLRKYRDSPKFALNWLTELGHDYMNKVNVADDDFANFLIKHYEEVKESFLFVFSDHGHRFDSIRRTAIGRIEESLPFFSMHIPIDLRERFPRIAKTVERNTQVLTSFWDFYVTMRDILDLGQRSKSKKVVRNDSLQDRNCKEAGIPYEFCRCYVETSVDTENVLIQQLANKVIDHLNCLLKSFEVCAQLVLSKIIQAEVIANEDLVTTNQYYRLTVEAKPSKGIFEALLKYNGSTGTFDVSGKLNRVNSYGNQSICVYEQELRKFCYCTNESVRIK
ncbi:unnamed protein product [Angiostrongylus costaricensis]|uniref:Sulfatase domain-containing protein n=1 Tax=Angiostrongylus costaricensis TaxID=334426 RepID=A0A158PFB1_ANGCS|nr:unnamed protein product [Angiostrongylus costaricensis]